MTAAALDCGTNSPRGCWRGQRSTANYAFEQCCFTSARNSGSPDSSLGCPSYVGGLAVWAIEESRLCNYLVPRECPRVTYYADSDTTEADVERFLGSSPAVVAIESVWLDRLRSTCLYCYHLPPDTFECHDACAGYFVSRVPVVPDRVDAIRDPVAELLRRGVELRILPNLWSLRDAVAASTLQFSLIRMRNAVPRATA